nr:two-component regulator propeller domain-containing protein [uncultured Carboxylicivirga sp.]
MKYQKLFWTIILFQMISSITVSYAEINSTSAFKFNHLNNNNGLSDNTINTIFQDKDGFIWLGTSHGLNRFDGYNIITFLSYHNSSFFLSENRIKTLAQDKNDNLWIGTSKGIDILNLKTRQIEKRINTSTYPLLPGDDILFMHLDFKNQMWIGTTKGIVLYNSSKDILQPIIQENSPQYDLDKNAPTQIAEDKNGNIWLASPVGLYRYNNNNGILSLFSFKDNDKTYLNTIKAIHIHGNHLWAGTGGGQFFSIDINHQIDLNTTKVLELEPNEIIPINSISVYEDQVWIGSVGHGLFIYDLTNKKFSRYRYNIDNDESISWDVILSLFNDRNGSMWIGTYGKGVDIWHPTLRKFKTYKSSYKNSIDFESITSITSDYLNRIWVSGYGRQNNVNVIDQANKKITHLGLIRDKHFNVFTKDLKSDGRIIWGCQMEADKQLFKIDAQNLNVIKTYNLADADIETIELVDDSLNNKLWIGTFDGIICFDKKTESISIINNIQDYLKLPNPIKVYSIIPDGEELLWLATDAGLIKYNHHSSEAQLIKSIDDKGAYRTLDIIKDKNIVWLATSNGLLSYDIETNQIKHLGDENELLSSLSVSIEEDLLGNLWIGTNKGIIKFNPSTKKVTLFTKDDGLQSNDFSQGVKYIDPKGNLYFGGTDGFNVINPTELMSNILPPPVRITKLLIHNKEIIYDPSENRPQKIDEVIEYCDELTIKNTDYVVSFEFSALNYIQSNKNQYAYILDGFEKDWNMSENRRFITYTNLPPGTYTLKVKASNNDGVWNEKGTELKIIVQPPFYKKWWFRTLLAAFIVSASLLFYFVRIKMLKNKEERLKQLVRERTFSLHEANEKLEEQKEEITTQKELLEQKNEEIITQNEILEEHRNHLEELVTTRTKELAAAKDKAEESDRLKTAFLANMSHEIRTPMNAIIGFSTLLRHSDFSDEEKVNFIDQIQTNGDSLLHLIDDIIDLAKIEAGQLKLIYKNFDVNGVLLELLNTFRHEKLRLHKNNIAIDLCNPSEPEFLINSDPYRLKQVLSNLLSNAIKYTESGSIEFGYNKYDDLLEFFVKDTGIGIEPKSFEHIFERFNKANNNGGQLYGGTGLGLSISKQIIDNLGGEMSVESEVGKGSRFSFTIPL